MLKPRVEVRTEGPFLVAEFWDCWRLDPNPVQDLKGKFDTHVAGKGAPILLIDMQGVGFAGSAALGKFLAIDRQAKPRDGRLIFYNVEPTVREVFKVSKLEPFFGFAATFAEALEMAGQGGKDTGPASKSPEKPPEPRPKPSGPLQRPRRTLS